MLKKLTSLFSKLVGRNNKTHKTGKVKFYNMSKGFGFIKEDSGVEVFVHASSLKERIREGDLVQFELENGEKGPNAINVKVIS